MVHYCHPEYPAHAASALKERFCLSEIYVSKCRHPATRTPNQRIQPTKNVSACLLLVAPRNGSAYLSVVPRSFGG